MTSALTSVGGATVFEPLSGTRKGHTDESPGLPSRIGDTVSVSPTARQLLATEEGQRPRSETGSAPGQQNLSEDEKREVEDLKRRDREVRAHEQAHVAGLGAEGGRANYTYTTGPDGKKYATDGEVPVQISEVPDDPQATLERAQRIANAALAPANPSSADRAAAAKARALAADAREQLAEERKEGIDEADPASGPKSLSSDATAGSQASGPKAAAATTSETADAARLLGQHTHASPESCTLCASLGAA